MLEKIDTFELENLALMADDDGIVQVILSRPAKRNALNAETIEELISVFSQLPRMGARAIVLRALRTMARAPIRGSCEKTLINSSMVSALSALRFAGRDKIT